MAARIVERGGAMSAPVFSKYITAAMEAKEEHAMVGGAHKRAKDKAPVPSLFPASPIQTAAAPDTNAEIRAALVEKAWSIYGCLGARIMGAGFGGSIIALVRRGSERIFVAQMGRPVIICATADGAYTSSH